MTLSGLLHPTCPPLPRIAGAQVDGVDGAPLAAQPGRVGDHRRQRRRQPLPASGAAGRSVSQCLWLCANRQGEPHSLTSVNLALPTSPPPRAATATPTSGPSRTKGATARPAACPGAWSCLTRAWCRRSRWWAGTGAPSARGWRRPWRSTRACACTPSRAWSATGEAPPAPGTALSRPRGHPQCAHIGARCRHCLCSGAELAPGRAVGGTRTASLGTRAHERSTLRVRAIHRQLRVSDSCRLPLN